MVQIAALWPLLMLLAFVMLGRGRCGPQPAAARRSSSCRWRRCSSIGSLQARPVRAALLLPARCRRCCCSRRASSRRRRCARAAVVVTAGVLTAVMVVGLVDQQLNGANPRLYDFKGAFAEIDGGRRARATSCCTNRTTSPRSSTTTGRTSTSRGRSAPRCPTDVTVWVVATERVLDAEEHVGAARHRARRARQEHRTVADAFERPERHACGSWCRRHDRRSALDGRPAALRRRRRGTATSSPRAARIRATRAGARQHGRPRRSTSAGCCGPDRVGNPVLFGVLLVAELFNVVQALGFWWTCLAGRRRRAARPPLDGAVDRRPSSTCSSRPTASRSRSSRPTVVAATRMRGAQRARRPARRRQPRRDGADGDAPRRPLRPPHAARRGQGRQHQPRPRAHRRPVRARPRLRPRAAPATCSSARCPSSSTRRVAYVQTPQYYANHGAEPARRRGVEPAGAVLRADRPRQGRPRLDVLLRHERRVPPRRARRGRRVPARAR